MPRLHQGPDPLKVNHFRESQNRANLDSVLTENGYGRFLLVFGCTVGSDRTTFADGCARQVAGGRLAGSVPSSTRKTAVSFTGSTRAIGIWFSDLGMLKTTMFLGLFATRPLDRLKCRGVKCRRGSAITLLDRSRGITLKCPRTVTFLDCRQ